jgi:hypothetical protein
MLRIYADAPLGRDSPHHLDFAHIFVPLPRRAVCGSYAPFSMTRFRPRALGRVGGCAALQRRESLPALERDLRRLGAVPGLCEPPSQASIQNRLSRLLEVGGDPELSLHAIETTDGAFDLQPARAGGPLPDQHRTSAEAAAFVVQRHREEGYPVRAGGDMVKASRSLRDLDPSVSQAGPRSAWPRSQPSGYGQVIRGTGGSLPATGSGVGDLIAA